jgi:hypothetical protein
MDLSTTFFHFFFEPVQKTSKMFTSSKSRKRKPDATVASESNDARKRYPNFPVPFNDPVVNQKVVDEVVREQMHRERERQQRERERTPVRPLTQAELYEQQLADLRHQKQTAVRKVGPRKRGIKKDWRAGQGGQQPARVDPNMDPGLWRLSMLQQLYSSAITRPNFQLTGTMPELVSLIDMALKGAASTGRDVFVDRIGRLLKAFPLPGIGNPTDQVQFLSVLLMLTELTEETVFSQRLEELRTAMPEAQARERALRQQIYDAQILKYQPEPIRRPTNSGSKVPQPLVQRPLFNTGAQPLPQPASSAPKFATSSSARAAPSFAPSFVSARNSPQGEPVQAEPKQAPGDLRQSPGKSVRQPNKELSPEAQVGGIDDMYLTLLEQELEVDASQHGSFGNDERNGSHSQISDVLVPPSACNGLNANEFFIRFVRGTKSDFLRNTDVPVHYFDPQVESDGEPRSVCSRYLQWLGRNPDEKNSSDLFEIWRNQGNHLWFFKSNSFRDAEPVGRVTFGQDDDPGIWWS